MVTPPAARIIRNGLVRMITLGLGGHSGLEKTAELANPNLESVLEDTKDNFGKLPKVFSILLDYPSAAVNRLVVQCNITGPST